MKALHKIVFTLLLLCCTYATAWAGDYKDSPTYKNLYQAMLQAFNTADSTKFFKSVKELEDYLLKQNDLHNYYTQRCNEIIFLMNRNHIFEAYKLAQELSKELRQKKLDKEMYMAINMMGHIYSFCGNKQQAKRCFHEVIERMEAAGYHEGMSSIYMNIVNVEINDEPEEAMQMIDRALEIAREAAPQRVFDIETRRTLAYYETGDTAKFIEGFKKYREGVEQGLTSVHGNTAEVYNLALQGKTDEAIKKLGDQPDTDNYSTIAKLYKDAGRWREALETMERMDAAKDSLSGVILSNSMQGIQDEYNLYEAERKVAKTRLVTFAITTLLLLLLIAALAYIIISRKRHIKQLRSAYKHALESDNMKSAFIQNVSHEVRTPLNIISGFAQVIADPMLDTGPTERQHMAQLVKKNTNIITTLIDEMLELSSNETGNEAVHKEDNVELNHLLKEIEDSHTDDISSTVKLTLESQAADDFKITTNEMMFKRIVDALLSNAIKNTANGTISLKAQTDADTLTMTIEDTGCGVPDSEAERIFERFVKLDEFKVGIGLGLPLCRMTAQKLGGNVKLDTSYKDGARFVVTLPIA